MAYIKYKEITHYFNFNMKLDLNNLPDYVADYLLPGETVTLGYTTNNDKFIMTTQKMIIFDVRGLRNQWKRIHIFPFVSVSSSAIEFHKSKVSILVTLDSGYQYRLNFIDMSGEEKMEFRKIYRDFLEDWRMNSRLGIQSAKKPPEIKNLIAQEQQITPNNII